MDNSNPGRAVGHRGRRGIAPGENMRDSRAEPCERLFSYGKLQLEPVQLATFGRKLGGSEDHLVGYRPERLEIHDTNVIETSGRSIHSIAVLTGQSSDRVRGTVFRMSIEELRRADAYETADYSRECLMLASGTVAWAHVDARREDSCATPLKLI